MTAYAIFFIFGSTLCSTPQGHSLWWSLRSFEFKILLLQLQKLSFEGTRFQGFE